MNDIGVPFDLFLVVVNCAFGASLLCVLALAFVVTFRRLSPRTYHNVLLGALVVALALPAIQSLLTRSEIGVIALQSAISTSDSTAAIVESGDAPILSVSSIMGTVAQRPRLRAAIVAIWLFGVCYCFTRLIIGIVVVRRVRQAALAVTDRRALDALTRAVKAVGLASPPDLKSTNLKVGPMVIGFRRPVIILPRPLIALLTDKELACVLIHECEHIRRKDVLFARIEQLSLCLYWWNPLAMLVHRQIDSARERACDDQVAAAGSDLKHYAGALLAVAQWTLDQRNPRAHGFVGVVSFIPRRDDLPSRVRRFRSPHRRISRLNSIQSIVLAAMVVFIATAASTPAFRVSVMLPPNRAPDVDRLTNEDAQLLADQRLAYVRIDERSKQDAIEELIRKNSSNRLRGLIVDLRKNDTLQGDETTRDLYRMVRRQVARQESLGQPEKPVVVLVQIQGVASAVMLRSIPRAKPALPSLLPRGPDDDPQLRLAINMLSHV